MASKNGSTRVAIACQGGGSHTAFTAGVLKKLLKEKAEGNHNFEIVALSGTSGGAICALLAWYVLLTYDIDKALSLLDSFWRANSTHAPWDKFLNTCLLQATRFFANIGGVPLVSPKYLPTRGLDQFRGMLEEHVDFDGLDKLVMSDSPLLLLGAADVLSGEFKAFSSRRDKITVDMILASAAIPTLFKAAHVDGHLYWDGLFSQNPPVRELPDERPDEIWVIAINPQTRKTEPRSVPEITDRRNEMARNLSLYQEVQFIEKMNGWVEEGALARTKHKPVQIKWIKMLRELDVESKLDRDPAFIQGMMAYGEEQAEAFLNQRAEVSEEGQEDYRRAAYG
ncbi:MAG: patatin-like phospholipase family protein [Gammaproteobacteria bacterium]|nr:patatin-like phospholipase family protein [Gammaproteobacteria bacterium]